MDNAVSLVRAYLQLHGFFVVTEYPLVELDDQKKMRTVTDIDILAFRFAHAGSIVSSAQSKNIKKKVYIQDKYLNPEGHQPDMLVAEVKEGYAKENLNMFQKDALMSVLTRFGCCTPEEFHGLYDTFIHTGKAELPSGHFLRSIVFGGKISFGEKSIVSEFIPLKHVLDYLNIFIDNNWNYVKSANFRDPTLNFLVTLQKATRASTQETRISKPKK